MENLQLKKHKLTLQIKLITTAIVTKSRDQKVLLIYSNILYCFAFYHCILYRRCQHVCASHSCNLAQ